MDAKIEMSANGKGCFLIIDSSFNQFQNDCLGWSLEILILKMTQIRNEYEEKVQIKIEKKVKLNLAGKAMVL